MDPMINQDPNPRRRRAQAQQKKRQAQRAAQARARRERAKQNARTAAQNPDRRNAASRRKQPVRKQTDSREQTQSTAQRERAQRAQIRRLREQQAGKEEQQARWSIGGIPMWGRMLIAVAAILLLLLVFFRVGRFEVSGNVHYTAEEISDASGVTVGDVLMGVNKTKAASRILVKLPYVRQVVVSKALPGTVRFTVVECEPMAALVSEFGAVWLINEDGKLLEKLDNPEEIGYPLIKGPALTLPTAGDPVAFEDSQTGSLTLEIAAYLTQTGLAAHVPLVDMTDPADIKLSYDERVEVQIGDGTDFAYRLEYMRAALEQLGKEAKGALDLRFVAAEKAIFHPLAE